MRILFAVLLATAAGAVDLVPATIVLPPEPSPVLALAGDELAGYLHRLTGNPPLRAKAGSAVTGTAVRLSVAADLRDRPDSYRLIATDREILIQGGSHRGVLFGGYGFLERLGCRWLAQDIEFVPTGVTAIAPFEAVEVPAFDLRTFVCRGEGAAAWGAKMGLNGFSSVEDAARYGCEAMLPGTHTYEVFLPAETYWEPHPEWYPLIRGERMRGGLHAGQLCVTAPGVVEEYAQNVIALIEQHPQVTWFSISPNDGRNWCECAECLALDRELNGGRTIRMGLEQEQPFMGDRVFWFANQVARIVGRTHPDKKLLCLAYVNYAEPPDGLAVEPNVIPWLCHYAPADYSRPIADPTSAPNQLFDHLLHAWAERRPDLLYYGYVSKSMWWRLPRPVRHNFIADIRHLRDLGIHRYYAQSRLSDWALDGPMPYVLAKALWNPDLDQDAVARDWLQHMFGPGAAAMERFYAETEAAVKASGQSYSDNPPRDVPGLFDPTRLELADVALDDALAATTGEFRARLEEAAKVWRYGREMIRSLEAAAAFRETAEIESAQAASTHAEAATAILPVREAVKFRDSLALQTELGVVSKGLGTREQKGGRDCWNTDETGPGDGQSGWASFLFPVPDPTRPLRVEMDVWGESTSFELAVNTSGDNKGRAAGGVWTGIQPNPGPSGQPRWETIVYEVPPGAMAQGKQTQITGIGGGDSQIWIGAIRVLQPD